MFSCAHVSDDAATSVQPEHGHQVRAETPRGAGAGACDGAGMAVIDAADAKKSGEPGGGAGGALGESKSTHPTIAAALGFGINKLSPSKDGRRYPCSVCSSTFTRVDNMRAHMLKFHGIEVAPSSTGNSRRSTPVSMVASHCDAGRLWHLRLAQHGAASPR